MDIFNEALSSIDQSLDRCENLIKINSGLGGEELAQVRIKLLEARMWFKKAQTEKLYEYREPRLVDYFKHRMY